jgi:hypothetical protein
MWWRRPFWGWSVGRGFGGDGAASAQNRSLKNRTSDEPTEVYLGSHSGCVDGLGWPILCPIGISIPSAKGIGRSGDR